MPHEYNGRGRARVRGFWLLVMRRWAYNVLIAFDQLGNALSGGNPDETISSRLGRLKLANGGTVPKRAWFYLARPLDAVLEWIDPNHSINSIEESCGKDTSPRQG